MDNVLLNTPLSALSTILADNSDALESLVINGVDLDQKYGFYSRLSKDDQDIFKSAGIIDNRTKASNANMLKLYKYFLKEYTEIRRAFSRSAVRDNIDVQREIVIKERELIQRTIRLMDSVPENGVLNLAVFSATLCCTLGLSTCALSLPAGALGISTTIPETVAATAAIAAAPGAVYIVLKMIGMSVRRTDQSNSVLVSQKTTGVLSKQLLIGKLNSMLAKTDKKLQCILSKQLLDTNIQVLNAMHKYNEESMGKLIAKVDEMQRGLEKDLVNTTGKYFPGAKANKDNVPQRKLGSDAQFEDPNVLAKVNDWNGLNKNTQQKIKDLRDAYASALNKFNSTPSSSPQYDAALRAVSSQRKTLMNFVKQVNRY